MARKTLKRKMSIYLSDEPEFSQDMSKLDTITVLNWYNVNIDKKVHQKWILDWGKKNGYKSSVLSKVPNSMFGTALGAICRMNERGLILTDHQKAFVKNQFETMIAATVKPVKNTEAVSKISPADVVKRKTDDFLAYVEGVLDDWENEQDFSLYTAMKNVEASPHLAKAVLEYYTRVLKELDECLKEKPEDLVEAYSYMPARTFKKYHKFVENIVNDAIRFSTNKKGQRKVRVKKPISTEKLISKVKYKKEDVEYKLESVNPVTIIGATCLFVFNTKYRELQMYFASDDTGFSIKGTTLQNYNEELSKKKKMRKPEEVLTGILQSTRKRAENNFKAIKTKEALVTGRLNEDSIILRVIK